MEPFKHDQASGSEEDNRRKTDGGPLLHELEKKNASLRAELARSNRGEPSPSCQALLNAVEGPCFALDREFCYLLFNDKHAADMARKYGTSPVRGGALRDLLAGQAEWERMEAIFRRTLLGEAPVTRTFAGDGADRRILEIHHTPIKGRDGEIIGLTVVAREVPAHRERTAESGSQISGGTVALDAGEALGAKNSLIGELRKSRGELQRLNAMKDRFFSLIAHDLRSPFNGFLNITKALTEDIDEMTLEDVRDCCGILYASALGFYELLENLLVWASVQQGTIECERVPQDLSSVILRNLDIVRPAAHKKKIRLDEACPPAAAVVADPAMLDTILRNLLSNALKFTHPGGCVSVTAEALGEAPDHGIRIEVSDTGVGIPPDMLPHLFSPDGRTGRTGTAGEVSSGLGLILTHEFIRLNGGRLDVRSRVGEGTTFGFTLAAPKGVS